MILELWERQARWIDELKKAVLFPLCLILAIAGRVKCIERCARDLKCTSGAAFESKSKPRGGCAKRFALFP